MDHLVHQMRTKLNQPADTSPSIVQYPRRQAPDSSRANYSATTSTSFSSSTTRKIMNISGFFFFFFSFSFLFLVFLYFSPRWASQLPVGSLHIHCVLTCLKLFRVHMRRRDHSLWRRGARLPGMHCIYTLKTKKTKQKKRKSPLPSIFLSRKTFCFDFSRFPPLLSTPQWRRLPGVPREMEKKKKKWKLWHVCDSNKQVMKNDTPSDQNIFFFETSWTTCKSQIKVEI